MQKHKTITISLVSILSIGGLLWLNSSNTDTPELAVVSKTSADQAQQKTENNNVIAKIPSKLPSTDINETEDQEEVLEQQAPLSPIDRIKAIQQKTALHEAIIDDHNRFTRYPDYNQKISSAEQDPTEKRYAIDERTSLDEETHTALTIWSDKKYYLHGDIATIYASLQDANQAPIPSQFLGQLIYNESSNLQQFEFTDENQDGIYEYRIDIDAEKIAGLYKVLIVNKTNKLADAITFTLSEPALELTGNFRDKLNAQGNLLIETEISVSSKNRFYFQASLYSASNTPIGTTQHSGELAPGKHWIPLEFDGLMIHDAQEEGPFLLKNLSLAKVALPIQLAPLAHPEFYTRDYSLSQFRSTQYAASQ